jgi:hypothetical protein
MEGNLILVCDGWIPYCKIEGNLRKSMLGKAIKTYERFVSLASIAEHAETGFSKTRGLVDLRFWSMLERRAPK